MYRMQFPPAADAEENRDLAARGDRPALIARNLRLVAKLVRQREARTSDGADLFSEGVLGLATAARDFDPARGVPFAIYACWQIRSALRDSARREARQRRLPTSGTCRGAGTEPACPAERYDVEARDRLEWLLTLLDPQEREVMSARCEGLELAEIAAATGRDPYRVKKLNDRAIGKLRRRLGGAVA